MLTVGMVGWYPAAEPAEREADRPSVEAPQSAAARSVRRGALRSAALPQGLNGVYVVFEGRRWFSEGRAVEYDSARFQRAGQHAGYPVYRLSERRDAIFIQIFEGPPGLLSVYRAR
jgi:hypothetical protein